MPNVSQQPTLGDIAADLARRWATQRLAAVQSYGRILADYGAGRSTSATAAGALVKLAAEEAVRYPADAIGLATDYASALARRAGVDLGVKTSTARAAPPIQDLEIFGPLGGVASGEFFLRNPHERAAQLSFQASAFSDSLGQTSAMLSFDPPDLVLGAGEEQVVRFSMALDDTQFAAGRSYVAIVAITGADDMILRVRLAVVEAG